MSSVTRILSPDEWAKRQIATLEAVGEANYKTGIAHPKKDPIEAGKAAEPKFAASMKKVVEEKRRLKGLEKTDMAQWFKYSSELGADRIVEGVVKRVDKVKAFITIFQPLLTDHVSKIDALPDVSDKEREDKVIANIRGMRALKGKA